MQFEVNTQDQYLIKSNVWPPVLPLLLIINIFCRKIIKKTDTINLTMVSSKTVRPHRIYQMDILLIHTEQEAKKKASRLLSIKCMYNERSEDLHIHNVKVLQNDDCQKLHRIRNFTSCVNNVCCKLDLNSSLE